MLGVWRDKGPGQHLGCRAAMPPGGRRGDPVTKRRKRLWSLLSSSEITSRKWRMAVLSAVYLRNAPPSSERAHESGVLTDTDTLASVALRSCRPPNHEVCPSILGATVNKSTHAGLDGCAGHSVRV